MPSLIEAADSFSSGGGYISWQGRKLLVTQPFLVCKRLMSMRYSYVPVYLVGIYELSFCIDFFHWISGIWILACLIDNYVHKYTSLVSSFVGCQVNFGTVNL